MKDIQKATQRFKELYGIDHPMQSPQMVKNRVRNFRSKSDIQLEDEICNGIRKNSNGNDTTFKHIIYDTFCKFNIPCETDKKVGPYLFDLYLNTKNLLIQICPTITHNDIVSFDKFGNGISSMLHKQEAEYAQNAGYDCIHIFDWDNIFILFESLNSNENVHENLVVEKIDKQTYDLFCLQYYMGNPNKTGTYNYGLYSGSDLLAVMSFRKSTSDCYDWEIVRYCESVYGYNCSYVKLLLDKFISDNQAKNIVMYVDQSKFSGKELMSIGFKLKDTLYPQRIWSKGIERILHTNISGRKYDDIFHTNYNSDHSLYTQMIEHGWLPVYDCGKKVYVYSEV